MRVAAYARYSSDSQRQASLEDQLRNCRTYAARMGWPAPVEYTDAAMSGARTDRPGYARLMDDAQRYDVILVDDLSRLARDTVETLHRSRSLTFAGVRLIGVSDGVDTGRKSHKAEIGLRGMMAEMFLDDLADKTHRGLAGRALSGASAGGLPYGYRVTSTGQRAIVPEQAEVVRRIFSDYASGVSPRVIACALNAEGIRTGRGGTWSPSAIYPDKRRGIGVLTNPIYIGRQVWNRSHWVKHPETGRRVRRERPEAEWIMREVPDLAIVDRGLWEDVQARIAGKRTARAPTPVRPGRPSRNLLSGLLRCADCGGPIVVVDARSYGCNIAKDRGTCENRMRIPRREAERAMLAGVRAQLLGEQAFAEFRRRVAAALKTGAPSDADARKRLAKATSERDNIMSAIKAGIVTASTRAALEAAEAAIIDAEREIAQLAEAQPVAVIPRLRETWAGIVADLTTHTARNPAARDALRALIGEATVRTNENGDPVAEVAAILPQIKLVAGARSGCYLQQPALIPLRLGREV